ncbi:hypothetical protein ACI8AK_02415 [Geodermatophilus sp. SYSU D00867]
MTATLPGRDDLAGPADELLDDADQLLAGDLTTRGGWWPRATGFLLRAALERELAAYWTRAAPGVEQCSMRAQLAVLRRPEYAGVRTATDVAAAWLALSRACHHHAYELAPTLAELRGWAQTVRGVTAVLRRRPA